MIQLWLQLQLNTNVLFFDLFILIIHVHVLRLLYNNRITHVVVIHRNMIDTTVICSNRGDIRLLILLLLYDSLMIVIDNKMWKYLWVLQLYSLDNTALYMFALSHRISCEQAHYSVSI